MTINIAFFIFNYNNFLTCSTSFIVPQVLKLKMYILFIKIQGKVEINGNEPGTWTFVTRGKFQKSHL